MTNFTDMLSKAKAMQDKMKEAQEQIKKIEVEGTAGGNLVTVKLAGDYELKSIKNRISLEFDFDTITDRSCKSMEPMRRS